MLSYMWTPCLPEGRSSAPRHFRPAQPTPPPPAPRPPPVHPPETRSAPLTSSALSPLCTHTQAHTWLENLNRLSPCHVLWWCASRTCKYVKQTGVVMDKKRSILLRAAVRFSSDPSSKVDSATCSLLKASVHARHSQFNQPTTNESISGRSTTKSQDRSISFKIYRGLCR